MEDTMTLWEYRKLREPPAPAVQLHRETVEQREVRVTRVSYDYSGCEVLS